jgi:hypothetical protein
MESDHEKKRKRSGGEDEVESEALKKLRIQSHHFLTRAPLVPRYIANRVLQKVGKQIGQRGQFLTQICRYWALKREARRGAPLLKRLHLEPWTAYANIQTESEKERSEKYAVSMVVLGLDEIIKYRIDTGYVTC